VFWSPIGKGLGLSLKEPRLDSEGESDLDVKSRLVVIGVRVDSDTVSLSARSSVSFIGRVSPSRASRASMRHPWRLPLSSALQTHDPKMKIDPIGKIMLSKS
jgi:hypothetical protein